MALSSTKPRVALLVASVIASLGYGVYAYAAAFPAPTISSHPSDPTTQTSASFTYTDKNSVTRFECSLDASAFAACGTARPSAQSYAGPVSIGSHTFKVRAVAGSQTSSATSFTWTIKGPPPPQPVITQHPPNPSSTLVSTFAWTDSQPSVTFACSIGDGTWQGCSSSYTFTVPASPPSGEDGEYEFAVRAVNAAGSRSAETQFEWKVSNDHFTIAGNVCCLYPGVSVPIPVAITNPNGYAIQVNQLTVGLSSNPAGCQSSWIAFQQSTISSSRTVTVPAQSTITLTSADQPHIQLIDAPVNQDACKNQSFGLQYGGTATHS